MEEPIPPPASPIVAVADAIRVAHHHRFARPYPEWGEEPDPMKLVWLECAYAAVSAWTMRERRPPPQDP